MMFNQPLDKAYSRFEIYDACHNRVDKSFSVTLSQMKSDLARKPRGRYKVFYFANGTPKGATGETSGSFTFTVKKGPACQ